MSLPIAFIIMVVAGMLGGTVNYLLPANENPETHKKIRSWPPCVILGFGATFLIPLFLEIAQSKLLDGMYTEWSWNVAIDNRSDSLLNHKKDIANTKKDTVILKITPADTIKKKPAETTYVPLRKPVANNSNSEKAIQSASDKSDNNPLKSYLLYGAYCLLAAAAGFKFINMLINNVVKDKELNEKTAKIEDLEKEKEKRLKNSQISQQQEDATIRKELTKESLLNLQLQAAAHQNNIQEVVIPVLPVLPQVIHPEDPQKGRFGGKSANNFRELKAEVTKSNVPGFYKVKIWVESSDPQNNPLNADVIFYIHDSFSPSVYTIKTNEFIDGKALDDEILSYGAFTVGVITDNGQTMLELDLAEDQSFPKEFRER